MILRRTASALAWVVAAVPAAHAQSDGERLALSLRNNVVSIVADRPGGERNGFGIIVGERAGRVFIATANHVVRGDEPHDIPKRIGVRFHQRREVTLDGKLLGASDARYDLAIIEAPAPPGLDWYRETLRTPGRALRGTDVWFVGRGGAWYIPTQPGRLNRVTLDFRIHVDDLNVQPGSSGAPLLAADGIVGIILADEATRTSSALSIEIVERAVRLWDLPWDLKPLTARAAIPALSPEIGMHLSAGDQFLQVGQISRAIDEFQAARKYDARNTDVIFRIVRAMRMSLWDQVDIPSQDLLPEHGAHGSFAPIADSALQLLYQGQGIDASLKNNKEWLLEEARIRRGRREWRLAVDILRKAREVARDDPDVMSELGIFLARVTFGDRDGDFPADQYKEGITLLRRAVAARPDHAAFHLHLGFGLQRTDAAEAAREYYRAATLSTGSDEQRTRINAGARHFLTALIVRFGRNEQEPWENGRLPAAEVVTLVEFVRPAMASRSETQWADGLLAAAHYNLGNLAAAERRCREALPKDLDDAMGYRYTDPDLYGGPLLVVLARILERSGSDPATLLALRMFLGRPNHTGMVVRNSGEDGLLVEAVDGGLGGDARLAPGDSLVAVDGEDATRLTRLARLLTRKKAGDSVSIEVIRSDRRRTVLTARSPGVLPPPPPAQLGVTITNRDVDRGDRRVRVTEIRPNGPAASAGISVGDDMLSLNGVTLLSVQHLIYVLGGHRPGTRVQVAIERDGKKLDVSAVLVPISPSQK